MSIVIAGIGLATPPLSIAQRDAADAAKTFVYGRESEVALLPALYRMTMVKRRSSVLLEPPDEQTYRQSFYPPAQSIEDRGPTTAERMKRYAVEAPPLALHAANRALAAAELSVDRVTHLVTVSCTGFSSPGVEFELIRQLGLQPTVARANIGFMGCHGVLNGLRVARAFATEPQAQVLLCSVELCSLHYHYGWDSEKVVANALFGDGAAAAVIAPGEVATNRWRMTSFQSLVLPDSNNEMSWNVGDHGFDMTLSPRVPSLVEEHLRPGLQRWLGEHGLSIEQVGSWAIHPGGPRVVSGVAAALGLEKPAAAISLEVLAEHGNMSSATVLFVIQRLQEANAALPCVALAFGPGLVAEAALFT
ncbi:type III polyketide synthase [Lignipirellula cremea]|uniref:Alpha-pyrone synthesis polyketide synthase-like Pks18 n=1 Tax=Lignipirellula cremea TaxID=2528010 RepID=A0A518DPQ9_9BACT|nr:type III polyketide synthase [Lignipirellula cremea]QDU93818.1 Alpha-pyrone synthesis polyketide synthase-like Pks18 [Lignipirellula cremea]